MSLVLGVDIVDVSSQRPPRQAFLRSNSFTALNIFQLMIITMICSLTALLEKANSKPTINQTQKNQLMTEFLYVSLNNLKNM
jgi:hypothetical protein